MFLGSMGRDRVQIQSYLEEGYNSRIRMFLGLPDPHPEVPDPYQNVRYTGANINIFGHFVTVTIHEHT